MNKYLLAFASILIVFSANCDPDTTWDQVEERLGVDPLNEDESTDDSVLKTSDENADLARRQKEAREDEERIYKDDGYWSARENQQSKKTFDEAMPASKAIRKNIDKAQKEQKLGMK